MGGGCNSCKLLPEEKLKIDSAIIPPFVVGEDSDPLKTHNVAIWDNNKTLDLPNVFSQPTIAGSHCTFKTNREGSPTILGSYAQINNLSNGENPLYDGVEILGTSSRITGVARENIYDYALRGATITGSHCRIKSPKNIDAKNFRNHNLLQGTTLMGGWCEVQGRIEGVVISGACTEPKLANNGVFVAGSIYTQRYNAENENERTELCFSDVNNQTVGISIVGSRFERNNGVEERLNGLVRFSADATFPHEIHGHIKLMDDFHCYNKDGVEIFNGSTAKTINELQTRVLELESQLKSVRETSLNKEVEQ